LHRQFTNIWWVYVYMSTYVQEKGSTQIETVHAWARRYMHALSSIRILSWKNKLPPCYRSLPNYSRTILIHFFFHDRAFARFSLRVEQVSHPKRYCRRKVMTLPGILRGLLRNRRTSVTSVSRPKLFGFVNFWSTFEYLIIGLVKKIICIICFVCDLFNRQMYFKHALSSRIFATSFWIRSMVNHRMDKSTTTRFLNKILHRGEFFFC
jgi:hypothetical protein